MTLAGSVQMRPDEATEDSMTVPVRPLSAVTVIAEVPDAPASIWAGLTAPADIEKSTKTKLIVPVVWDSVPSVPVIVTVYELAVLEVQLRLAVCGEVPKVTLNGVKVHVSPAGVDAETVNWTVPVRPFRAVTVIVVEPDAPANIWLGLTAPAAIEKSTTWNTIGPDV